MKKLILLLITLLLIPFIFAYEKEVSNTIYINHTGNNLTIRTDYKVWAFNTDNNFSAELNNKFNTTLGEYVNCSYLNEFIDAECEQRSGVYEVNKKLSVDIDSCDYDKNRKCSEQKDLYNNCTSTITSRESELSTCNIDKTNCGTKLITCDTESKTKDNNWIYGILAGLAAGYVFWVVRKTGTATTRDEKDTGKKMPEDEQVNQEALQDAFDSIEGGKK